MKFCKTIKEFAIITVGTAIVAAAVFFFMLADLTRYICISLCRYFF